MSFNLDEMLGAASELKYTREIKRIFGEMLANPSEEFVRLFAAQVYSGRLMQRVLDQFTEVVRRALNGYISDRVSDRLRSALDQESAEVSTEEPSAGEATADGDIVTTEDERRAVEIVRAIVAEVVDPERVVMRDAKSYCAVLLDDNNRKPICRLHLGRGKWAITFFDSGKGGERLEIQGLRDLYSQSKRLRSTVEAYEARDGRREIQQGSVSSGNTP